MKKEKIYYINKYIKTSFLLYFFCIAGVIRATNYKIVHNQDYLIFNQSQVDSLNQKIVLSLDKLRPKSEYIEDNELHFYHIFVYDYSNKLIAQEFLSCKFLDYLEFPSYLYSVSNNYIPSDVIISDKNNILIGTWEDLSSNFYWESRYRPGLFKDDQMLLNKIKEWDIQYLLSITKLPNIPILAISRDRHVFVFYYYKGELVYTTMKEYIISHKEYFE